MTDYLTLADVLAIHEDQIARHGPQDSVRDLGSLEAALFRPQTGYYDDLVEEATALWESLAQNYPFVDGNKRTAFAATCTFLAINEITITADADETYEFIVHLYDDGGIRFEQLAPWLRDHTAYG